MEGTVKKDFGDKLKALAGRASSISIPLGAEAVDAGMALLRPNSEDLENWIRNSSRVHDESEDPRSPKFRNPSVVAGDRNEPWIPDHITSSVPEVWTASLTPDMVINRLDERFFTPDFDPTRYFLEVQLTQEIFENHFHEFFQRGIMEKDVEKDMIMRKLASEVEKNYEELLNGLRQLNQTDIDLARANIDITNSRRRLQNAQHMLQQYSMKIISLNQRKQQLQAMKNALMQLEDLKQMVEHMEDSVQQGAFSEAASCAMQVRDVVQTPAFRSFHVAQHLYRRVQLTLPELNDRVDRSLFRVCSRRFTPAEYAEVVRSFLVLDNLHQDLQPQGEHDDDSVGQADRSALSTELFERIHQYILADLDNCCRTAIIEQLMLSGDYDEQSLLAASDFPIEVLYAKVQPMQLVLCAVRTCELLAEVIHTYFLIMQWHRRPFDPRNQDLDFLHNMEEDDIVSEAEHDDTATDAGAPSPAADKEARNAKLTEVYQQLLARRAHVWAHAQRGLTNMLNSVQATSTIPFDELLVVMWACDTFGAIGKEFCDQDSRALQSCMRIKSVQYFHHFHSESITVLKQMLEREAWRCVPVEVADLGGIDGMIAMNGRRGATDLQRSSQFNLQGLHIQRDLRAAPCVLQRFNQDGNPFSVADEATQGHIDVMASLLRETSPVPTATTPTRSPTKRGAGNSAVVTQAVLNGVLKYTGKYLAMMRVMKPAAADIFAGLCQMYDVYLLAVFLAFAGDEMQKLVLHAQARPLNEAPAPRDQLNFEMLLHYLEKVVPALVEETEDQQDDDEEEQKKEISLSERLLQFRSTISLDTDLDLAQSVVGAESAVYILSLLKDATAQLRLYLPGSYHTLIDDYIRDTSHASDQLRTLVYRSASRLLISPAAVIMEIEKVSWDTKELREEPHDFVQDLTNKCQRIWDALTDEGSTLAQVPQPAKEQVWLEVCQAVFDTILEGFSKARKISTEGKASMTMDLQALHSGINEIHLCRPPRGKEYVTGYIRASYFNEEDLMSWIHQNYEQYAFRHVASLLHNAMSSVLKKKKLKDALTQVEELYRSYLNNM